MNKRLYITLTVLSIILLSIGGTFALITTSMTAINITQIRSGNLTMTISGGGSENVSFVPSECTGENTIKKTITAKVTNTSGGKVSFSIGLNITALSDTYKKDTVKYALTTNANSCTEDLIANGSFKDKTVNSDLWLIKNDYDDITKSSNDYTKTYYLYIWLDESETEYFTGNISIKLKETSSNNPSLTTEAVKIVPLYSTLKSRANTTISIDFSKVSSSSNTNDIYMTTDTDSGEPVYYYRGNVDNHLIFANFCWRIIRTTETGGIKLIYDGVSSSGECNNTGDDTTIGSSVFNSTKNVGYMYGSSIDDTANTTDSTIKTFIDTWYKNNMTSYTSQLEDTVFCNDRSYTASGSFLTFKADNRLYTNKKPTLKCENTKDKFTASANNGNGALTYPIGLIAADEMAYAGGIFNTSNSSFYLYTGKNYWTLSPYLSSNGITAGILLNSGGKLNAIYVINVSYGVRPVISLKSGTEISSGSGTSTDPFIVE